MLDGEQPAAGRPVNDPALLAMLEAPEAEAPPPTIAERLDTFGRKVDRAIQGDAAEELPSAMGADFERYTGATAGQRAGNAAKALPALVFGQDADLGRKLVSQIPGSQMVQDANGNEVIETPDGKRWYVNQPGLDRYDAERLFANIASYIPAGRIAAGVGNLAGRIGAMSAGSAATNAAGQGMGRDEIDLAEVGITGAIGGLAETFGPIYRTLRETFRRAPTVAEVQAAAQKAGLNPGLFNTDEIKKLEALTAEAQAGASPAALQGEKEFGFRYTQGQKTQKHDQLSREELLRQGQGPAADQLRGVQAGNRNALERTVRDIGTRYGGQPPTSPVDAFGRTQGVVQAQADALGGKVSKAYDDVREAAKADRANVSVTNVKGLPKRIAGVLTDFPVGEGITPATDAVIAGIKKRIAGLPEGTKAVDLNTLDIQRRLINQAYKAAANPTDRAALSKLKREYDNWMDETYQNALSADKLIPLRDAQKLRAEYGKRFEGRGGDAAMDDFIESMVSGGKSADELINVAYGTTQISKPIAARYVQRLKVAFGDNKEAMNGLRAAHFLKLTTDKAGNPLGMQAIRNNILGTERNAPATIRELYTDAEWSQLKRLAAALEPMVAKGDFARSSGTAERLARMVATSRLLPGVRAIIDNVTERMQMASATGAMQPVRKPLEKDVFLPAAAAGTASGR